MTMSTALIARNPDDARWSQVRRALRDLDVTLLGEFHTADDVISQVKLGRPDLILTACRLNGESTTALVAELRRTYAPESRLVVFTDTLDDIAVPAFAQIGLDAFLAWQDVSKDDTFRCTLQLVLTGEAVVGSRSVAASYDASLRGMVDIIRPDLELSDFERRVLLHRAQGRTYQAIASLEGVNVRRVERATAEIRDKLDAPDQFVLAMKATLLGLIPHS